MQNARRPSNPLAQWWTRPCGGREVLAISLPLVISMGSWAAMHFCDRVFLSWYSQQAMAASLPAGVLYFTLLCLPLGVAMYVNTFVAQYVGAGRPERVGLVVWQGVRVGALVAPLYVAAIPLAPLVFRAAGHEAELAQLETLYLQVLTFGAGAWIAGGALSAFFTGRGATRVVMAVDSSAALLNIVLDYAWIFGRFGLPAMGIEGAAWGTVVANWFRLGVYLWLVLRPAYRERYQIAAGFRFDRPLFLRLLRYGGPNGLQLLAEVSAFTLFILLVGQLGEQAMAATTAAFNVNNFAFVPMLGLGMGLTAIVGQKLGANRPDLAARATWTALLMAWAYMGAMAALYVFAPDLFLLGHKAGMSEAEYAALRSTTVVLLRFVAAYCLFDAMIVVFAGALKGAGDMLFIFLTNVLMAPPLVLSVWIGVRFFDLGLYWSWVCVTGWVCALGTCYAARFLQGRWRTMRVIEHDAGAEELPSPPRERVPGGDGAAHTDGLEILAPPSRRARRGAPVEGESA